MKISIETLIVPDIIPVISSENETFELIVFYFALEGYCIYLDMVRRGLLPSSSYLERVPELLKTCGFDFEKAYSNWSPIANGLKSEQDFEIGTSTRRLYFHIPLERIANNSTNRKYQFDQIITCCLFLMYEYLDQDYSQEQCLHLILKQMLPAILELKIENKKSFKNFEKVFEYLSPEDQERSLFHLDILR